MCDKILEQAQNIWACVKCFTWTITTGGLNSTRFGGIVDFFLAQTVSTPSRLQNNLLISRLLPLVMQPLQLQIKLVNICQAWLLA